MIPSPERQEWILVALIRKYRDETDVVPHWETISTASECVIIAVHPEQFLWHDH